MLFRSVLERTELGSFDEMKEGIMQLQARSGINKGIESKVQKLKSEYNFQLNQTIVDALLAGNSMNGVLFYLNQHPYSSDLFNKFAKTHPSSVRNQLNAFINKSILDYEYSVLEQKYPDFKHLMQEYKDGMLLFEISNNQIWEKAVVDEAGQKAYFAVNKSNYKWDEPKFNGILVHCANKKAEKQIKKLIKKVPVELWRETINNSMGNQVKIEQGLFTKGDNPSVDALAFKIGNVVPLVNFPHTCVFGKKQRLPSSHLEVRGELISDYQNYLDSVWVKQLRSDAQVQINYDVLKTVNNH